MKLIRNPEFPQKVNDIVIEFGNPRYQGVLDRFVDGDDVPYAEVSKVWLDTTQLRALATTRSRLPGGRLAFTDRIYRNDSRRLVYLVNQDPRAKWFVVIPISAAAYPNAIARHAASSAKPVLLMATGTVGNLDAADIGYAEKSNTTTVRQIADACLYFGSVSPLLLVGPSVPPR